MLQKIKSLTINFFMVLLGALLLFIAVGIFTPTSVTITGTDRYFISQGDNLESWAEDFQSTIETKSVQSEEFIIKAGEVDITFPERVTPFIDTVKLQDTLGEHLRPILIGQARKAWTLVQPYSIQESVKPNTPTGSWELLARDIERQLGLTPLSEGAITVDTLAETPSVSFTPSQAGTSIDPMWIQRVVLMYLLENKTSFPLDNLQTIRPKTTLAELEEKKEYLENIFSSDVLLTLPEFDIEKNISPKTLASLFEYQWDYKELQHVLISNEENLLLILGEDFGDPVAEGFVVNEDYTVSIQAQEPGLELDGQKTLDRIIQSTESGLERTVQIAAKPQSQKQFEKNLEALQIKHLIASYTTYHSCCQGRVQNIQAMADIVDGTILAPGEEFSLNDRVGKRTRENGFVPAGTLLKGVLLNTTGGGVSQFTTTLYNSVFWSGLKDITHAPHSRYFSRYPEGIEATISWPQPHMKFANDYDSHVLIKTSYTDTSITVSIFGDNDGRIVRGNHKDKKSTLEILQDGGPAARVVTATKTDRFDPIAKPVQLIADKNIPTSAAKIMQKGSDGWKIKIERIITKGGEIFASQEWTVRYRPETAIIKTNSCETFEEIIPCRTTAEQKDFERNLVKQFGSGDE